MGLTTEMAAFVTFAVGIAMVRGYIVLSVSVTIVMILILSTKPKLHDCVKTIEPSELYYGIIFLIISAVMLPCYLIVVMTNALVKEGIFTFFIGTRKAWNLLTMCGIIVAGGVLGILFF
ncbi:MgtC/SapB family protein [Fodinibius saliphilus]|uniref:MgtC/SapB family protein n=1 Tax=Fodinibius saliphilus TaxID=1920650 RepID=UPI0024831913|nr:MgtC/SapB family protein [Fodinibius saliphilus]